MLKSRENRQSHLSISPIFGAAAAAAHAICLSWPASALQAAQPIDGSGYDTAGWIGSAFYDSEQGQFAYCRQGRAFDDGTILTFTLSATGFLDVGLIGGSWPSEPETILATAARLDEIGPVALDGVVDSLSALVLPLDSDPAIVYAFRRATLFEIAGDDFGPLSFPLSGTAASLTDLRNCFAIYRQVDLTPSLSDRETDLAITDTPVVVDDLQAGDLALLQAGPIVVHEPRQTFDRLVSSDLAGQLTGGADQTIADVPDEPVDSVSASGQQAGGVRQMEPTPSPYRPYRIGDDSNRFGSGGLYGTPYTIRPPSSPYSISTPGTASPYRR